MLRGLTILLILSAIVIGNAAYEAGNISGGVLGMETIFGNPTVIFAGFNLNVLSVIVGIIAFSVLYVGNYKVLERVLVSLVILMSMSFLVTAIITQPDLSAIFSGLFVPQVSEENLLTIIGLIGTTVVPYNLFLHASLVKEKWHQASDLKYARKDTKIAVVLGGTVSMSIIISAAAIDTQNISSAADLAKGLEPLFGRFAKYFLAIGLFAAGITSAITAPLAAAYVATGCMGWSTSMKSKQFKAVWMFILGLGVLFSSIGFKSIEIIKFAQIANGLLLPIIAGFLLWVMNKSSILGKYKNTIIQNVIGYVIVGVAVFLGAKSILMVFGVI
jgi:NRAMP (natural resistance-associated macrophage protein)-like metal ion transporter